MENVQTFLPVFQGFYGTLHEADEESEIYNINEEREALGLEAIDSDACEFDYKEYNNRVCLNAVDYIAKELNDLFTTTVKIVFEDLYSPKEYNFINDAINCTIKMDLDELKIYLINNIKPFKEYLKDKYTSYDGFYSSYSTDSNEWLNVHFNEIESNKHILGAILEFVCKNEDINVEKMVEYNTDHDGGYLSAINYEELTTK